MLQKGINKLGMWCSQATEAKLKAGTAYSFNTAGLHPLHLGAVPLPAPQRAASVRAILYDRVYLGQTVFKRPKAKGFSDKARGNYCLTKHKKCCVI